jgi:four helix bundle suffix protein
MPEGFIPPHGGYQSLLSFQRAQVVYDATVKFCADHLDKRDRTVDQMVQAVRSRKQNIVEGSMASGASRETEIKLTNVARASLEELLTDYRDFLRTRGAREWDKDSKEALYVRRLARGEIAPPNRNATNVTNVTNALATPQNMSRPSRSSTSSPAKPPQPVTFETFRPFFETRPPEVVANIIICLIHQTNYLLDQQLRRLEKDFLEQGGLRENMTRARLEHRAKQQRGEA